MKQDFNFSSKWISIIYREFQIYINGALIKHNINSSEITYLMTLNYDEDGILQDELCKKVSINKAAVTRALQSLENKEYVYRIPDNQNIRHKRVFLTKKGISIKDDILNAIKEWNADFECDIDLEDIRITNNTLKKMACTLIEKKGITYEQ